MVVCLFRLLRLLPNPWFHEVVMTVEKGCDHWGLNRVYISVGVTHDCWQRPGSAGWRCVVRRTEREIGGVWEVHCCRDKVPIGYWREYDMSSQAKLQVCCVICRAAQSRGSFSMTTLPLSPQCVSFMCHLCARYISVALACKVQFRCVSPRLIF